MSTAAPTAPARAGLPLRFRVIALIAMPLFFLTAFSLTYVSALHKPTPHDLALTIAGSATATEQVAESITGQADGAFELRRTTSASNAREAVQRRDAVGAILIDGRNVTTVIASGGGRVATAVVQSVGAQVAAGLGGTSTVQDVAPLTAGDTSGSTLFFLLVLSTVGAFLAITQIGQVITRPKMRFMIAVNAGVAVVVPVVGFSVLSAVAGDYGATFGETAAVIGIAMLYSFTCGLLASLFTRLLGAGAIFIEILVLVALNFPSAGGSVPGSMLPPFWQAIHSFWIGSGAMEAIRSIIYFGGEQAGRWMGQLSIWFIVIAVLTIAIGVITRRRGVVLQKPDPEGDVAVAAEAAGEAAAVSAV